MYFHKSRLAVVPSGLNQFNCGVRTQSMTNSCHEEKDCLARTPSSSIIFGTAVVCKLFLVELLSGGRCQRGAVCKCNI